MCPISRSSVALPLTEHLSALIYQVRYTGFLGRLAFGQKR